MITAAMAKCRGRHRAWLRPCAALRRRMCVGRHISMLRSAAICRLNSTRRGNRHVTPPAAFITATEYRRQGKKIDNCAAGYPSVASDVAHVWSAKGNHQMVHGNKSRDTSYIVDDTDEYSAVLTGENGFILVAYA